MLDDDDLDFTLLTIPTSGSGWAIGVGVLIAIIVAVIVISNKEDCSEKHCNQGEPVLIENACRCLERAE